MTCVALGESLITDDPFEIGMLRGASTTIVAPVTSTSPSADITVAFGGSHVTLEAFASPVASTFQRDGSPRYAVPVAYALLEGAHCCLVLLGDRCVTSINLEAGTRRDLLRLHRDASRDTGYDSARLVVSGNALLVLYERGCARIANDLTVLWHTELTWNDTLVRINEDQIYYWSEFANVNGSSFAGEFSVDLRTGSKVIPPNAPR